MTDPATPALELIVWRPVILSTEDLHFTLRMARHPENRAWSLDLFDQWDSLVTGTAHSMDGEDEPVVREVWWPPMPPCDCEVVATLSGQSGPRAIQRKPLLIR